jgi:hypothetical protein
MINVKQSNCLFDNCNKIPYFNLPDKKIGLYCDQHKLENMINIKSKRCEKCNKLASFGFDKPLYCSEHKLDNMIDVTHKKCKFESCNKYPFFNLPNSKTGLYCVEHKLENMIDIMHKKCKFECCNKEPHFNIVTEKVGIYCAEHKLENMVNVITKKCVFEGCNTIPYYNLPNLKIGLYCYEHKLENMIDVKSKKCKIEGCNKRPIYNFINQKTGLYCSDHKEKDMIDVINYRCKSSFCDIRIQSKTKCKGYCLHCFVHLFPDNIITTNFKTKENEVTKFILEKFKDKTWIIDKKIENGCSKRRPDLLLDLGFQVIIIEIDENQHIKYDCSCENKRLMELSKDLNHRSIVFIRFNPDDYVDKNNIKHKSCWKISKTGLINIDNIDLWNKRLNNLKNQIEYWISNQTTKLIEIIELYYNGFLE